jgi:hypothetical protein
MARFARQQAGMMRPVARSDISANEVSHSPFFQKYPYRIEFWSFSEITIFYFTFMCFIFSPPLHFLNVINVFGF